MAPLIENPETPPVAGPASPGPAEAVAVAAPAGAAEGARDWGPECNAVDHGLTATTRFPEQMQRDIDRRIADFTVVFQPTSEHELSLIAIMARGAVQWDEATKLQVENRDRIMDRAERFWDLDRKEHVLNLGAKLASDPERVQFALSETKQGVDYLISAWSGLLGVLDVNEVWDEAQRSLALDLLGLRREFRNGTPLLRPDSGLDRLRGVAEAEIGRLEAWRRKLLPSDQSERRMALEGMPMEEDGTTRRLRRYAADAKRTYFQAKKDLLDGRAGAAGTGARSHRSKEREVPPSRPPVSKAADEFMAKQSANPACPRRYADMTPAAPVSPVDAEVQVQVIAPASAAPAPKPAPPAAAAGGAPAVDEAERRRQRNRKRRRNEENAARRRNRKRH
jgi:hypothetical protein